MGDLREELARLRSLTPELNTATDRAISVVRQGRADFDKSGPIPDSETASLCTLSKIVLRRYVPHPDRSCELTPAAQRGDPWGITVDGAVCGVTCFALGAKQ